jgi:hypothetical protein
MKRILFSLFCLIVSVEARSQDNTVQVPFRDFVAVNIFFGSDNSLSTDIVLTNTADKKNRDAIVVNKTGLVLRGKTVCGWAIDKSGVVFGPLGYVYGNDAGETLQKSKTQPCPTQSPIQAARDYNYSSSSVGVLNEIVIHITGIDEERRIIEVPFQGAIYRGAIPAEFEIKLVPGKGTEIAKAAALRKEKLRVERAKELDRLGVNKTRIALLKCIVGKKNADCFSNLVPSGKSAFRHESVGEESILSAKDLRNRLGIDESFRNDFTSCVKGTGSSFKMSDDKSEKVLELVPDNSLEMYWVCKFVRRGDKWIFQSMSWSGC